MRFTDGQKRFVRDWYASSKRDEPLQRAFELCSNDHVAHTRKHGGAPMSPEAVKLCVEQQRDAAGFPRTSSTLLVIFFVPVMCYKSSLLACLLACLLLARKGGGKRAEQFYVLLATECSLRSWLRTRGGGFASPRTNQGLSF